MMPVLAARVTGRIPKWVRGYVLAAVLLAISTGLTLLLRSNYRGLPGRIVISGAFLMTMLACAWWGRYGPGAATVAFTFLIAPKLLIGEYHFAQVPWVNAGQLLAMCLLISWAASSRDKTEAALRRANEDLDVRVRQRTAELERANEALQEREAMLLRQTDELARSNTDLEQFAYVASHDLREPLRMIAIYTELLARRYRGALDAEADGFIRTVLDGVARMETLIKDLLTYSATIHAEPAGNEKFQTSDAVDAAMKHLEPWIRESGAKIAIGPLPEVAGDQAQFTRVFQNLLSNALKYRSDSAAEIRIRADQESGLWIFSVSDNGIGIQPDYHEMIFSPFKRLHGREYQGSGVGLAICRRIVERHGGRIWVESSTGEGATFRFTIPAAVQDGIAADRRAVGTSS